MQNKVSKDSHIKLAANNKKAYHEYFVEETFECGIALHGTEVKSIRQGKCSVKESFISFDKGEVFVNGMHVTPYEQGNIFNKDPLRPKKLLLHKSEIFKISGAAQQKGYTIIPLKVYLRKGLVKVEIGVCKGKKLYDKRAVLMEKDTKRQVERELKQYNR